MLFVIRSFLIISAPSLAIIHSKWDDLWLCISNVRQLSLVTFYWGPETAEDSPLYVGKLLLISTDWTSQHLHFLGHLCLTTYYSIPAERREKRHKKSPQLKRT